MILSVDTRAARLSNPLATAGEEGGGTLPYRDDVPTAGNTVFATPDTVTAAVRALAEQYPMLARVVRAGTSASGREITALVLGAHPDDPAVPRVLVTAGVHARETGNALLVLDWARDLLGRAAGGDAARGALLAGRTVVLVPQVSPDSAQEVARGLRSGALDDIWRRTNARGVDLNRNFPGPTWGAGSADPTSQNYHGPTPGSEPETQAVLALGAQWHPAAVYDIHSPGGVILVPSSAAGRAGADATAAAKLAARASGYDVSTSSDEWKRETGGTIKDWAHDVLHVPALTIETGAVHHPTPQIAADTRARMFPTLDALVATIDGRHTAPSGTQVLATPRAMQRYVMAEHTQGTRVRWPALALA